MTLNIKFKSTLLGQIWYLFGLGYCFTVASTAIAKPQLEAALPPLEAVQQSLVEHPNVRAAISEQDYADFARQGLKVGQNPWTVTAGMQVRKTDTQLERKQANSYEPSLGIEKQIRLPNKYRLDQDLAQRISSIAELKYENAQHQASKMLLNSWFAYRRSTLHLKRLQEQLDQIQQFIQVTEQRIRAGDAPRLELMLLKNEYQQLEEQYMQAKAAYIQAQQLLARDYRGKIPEQWSSDVIQPSPIQYSQAEWVQKILSVNHELALVRMQATQQYAVLKREQLNRLPDPTIGFGYSREQSGEENLLGVSVSIPLTARQVGIASGMAAAEAKKADLEVLRVEKRLRQEIQGWVIQMESATVRNTKAQENLQLLQQQHHLMQKAYKLGELNLNELLLHSQQLIEARSRVDQAKVDYAESMSSLLLDSHQLWPLHEMDRI